ncbi:MAG: thioredoxin domain-containing protein [Thermoanaerobaculia bacterium]
MTSPLRRLSPSSVLDGLSSHRVSLGVAAVLGALVLAPAPTAAQGVPSDAVLRNFELSGDFLLMLDGKEQTKAEIYFSDSARAYLVLDSGFASPILIAAPTQSVQTVDLMKVAKQPAGTIDLLADAILKEEGKYTVNGANIEFTYSGKKISLVQKPWLLGKHTGAELLAYNPVYTRGARDYNPDANIMKRLKAQKQTVRVLTFFGSWCPHCKKHVPLLLKVEQGLAGSKIQFEYYGLPKGLAFGGDPQAALYKIEGVPTAILFIGDKEIGRIPNAQWSNPEVALDLQLNGPKTQ